MIEKMTIWLNQYFSNDEYQKALDDISVSFGILLFSIIIADEKITQKERDRFVDIYRCKYNSELSFVDHLVNHIPYLGENVHEHAYIIKDYLDTKNINCYDILASINDLISVDGVDDRECQRFEEIKLILNC